MRKEGEDAAVLFTIARESWKAPSVFHSIFTVLLSCSYIYFKMQKPGFREVT